MKHILKLAFLLVLFQLPLHLIAQQPAGSGQQTCSFPELVSLLEQKHGVRIFYLPEWFEGKSFPVSLAELGIRRALEEAGQEAGLQLYNIDGNFAFAPGSQIDGFSTRSSEEIFSVGDPNDYGRVSLATITGGILDGKTGDPLIGAVLYDENTGTGTLANRDGKFSMEIPVGEHNFRLNYLGYETYTRKVMVYGSGSIDFELFEGTEQIREVTIMAQRAEANIMRTQMGMVSLDARTIKELPGVLGELDLIKSMVLLPGVQTVGELGTGFNVRGGSTDQNLILIEDVPLFNSSHLFGMQSVVNPEMVSSVNLIKAGIPARYGERASSVMEIRVNREIPEKASLRGGIGLLNSRLNLTVPVRKKVSLMAGARSSYTNWIFKQLPDLELRNSSTSFYDLSASVLWNLSPRNTVSLFGYRSQDGFSFSNSEDYSYASNLASFRWNSILARKLSFSLTAGISDYQYEVDANKDVNPFEAYRLLTGVRYMNSRLNVLYVPTALHAINTGMNLIRYQTNPGALEALGERSYILPKKMDPEQAFEWAAYISDNMTISPALSMEVGLRYSRYTQFGPASVFVYDPGQPRDQESIIDTLSVGRGDPAVSYGGLEPRLSLRYALGDSSSIKLSYNRVHQYINLISNTSVMTPADMWKLSDSHIRPLTADQVSLGYYRNFRHHTIETSVEVYYKFLNNIVDYKSGAALLLNNYLETDLVNTRGYNYGIEIYLKKNSGRLTGWTSYTFSSSMRRTDSPFPSEQINNNAFYPSNYDKPHNIVLNVNYQVTRRWRLNGVFNFSSGHPVTLPELQYYYYNNKLIFFSERNKYRLAPYHRLDLSVSFGENLRINQKGKGSWTFSVLNVYGRKNPYSAFYSKKPVPGDIGFQMYGLYEMYIIGRPIPTLTYNFSF